MTIRLAFFWVAYTFADIVAALAAAGLLQMRGVLGYSGWRWMFLVEVRMLTSGPDLTLLLTVCLSLRAYSPSSLALRPSFLCQRVLHKQLEWAEERRVGLLHGR